MSTYHGNPASGGGPNQLGSYTSNNTYPYVTTTLSSPTMTVGAYSGPKVVHQWKPPEDALIAIYTEKGPLVVMKNGDVRIPDGLEISAAAEAFWAAVRMM